MKPFTTNFYLYIICLVIHNKTSWLANQSKNLMQMYRQELGNHSDQW